MSIIKKLIDTLKEDGTEVNMPLQHKGECINKYIVVKMEGVAPTLNVSSERPIYTIMCYVPENNYSELESFVIETKNKMKKMFPLLMYNEGSETPSYYDETVKGHMISFQYLNCRKIENW